MFKPLSDPKLVEKINEINKMVHEAHVKLFHTWQNEIIFTWHWWINIALTILPWILWAKIREKESTHRLLYGGFAVIILSSFLDFLGFAFGLWGYNYKVAPTIPPFMPWDFTIIPVTAMLFYQFKQKINPYIKAAIYSALGSFVFQPLFAWLGFYNPLHWKHYYSFPIIFAIYLIGYWFVTRDKFEKIR